MHIDCPCCHQHRPSCPCRIMISGEFWSCVTHDQAGVQVPDDLERQRLANVATLPAEVQRLMNVYSLHSQGLRIHDLECEICGNPFNERCDTGKALKRTYEKWRKVLRKTCTAQGVHPAV